MVLAKGLVPTVRAAIKAEFLGGITRAVARSDQMLAQTEQMVRVLDKGKAVKVNGHSLRLDLPVVPKEGIKGIELLRVMDGLSSSATYLVAAVKGEKGIVAVRQFGEDYYNVKFYPTMAAWDVDTALLVSAYSAHSFCQRQWYERMQFTHDGLILLLEQLAEDAKPKSRMKQLVDRFLAVTGRPLLKAFEYLHKQVAA